MSKALSFRARLWAAIGVALVVAAVAPDHAAAAAPEVSVTIAAPSAAAGTYPAAPAAFGPQAFYVSGSVQAGNDGVALPTDGCEPLVGLSAGAIALLDRGDCDVTLQALNAQASGAVGVIIVSDVSGPAPPLAGVTPSVTIALVSVSQATGATIRAGLPAVGQLFREADADNDGHGNSTDNCPADANPDQADLDSDGAGDACDNDLDGDGVPQGDDGCPTAPGESDNGCPLPTSRDQCRRGGWMTYGTTFAQQGACLRYVNTGVF